MRAQPVQPQRLLRRGQDGEEREDDAGIPAHAHRPRRQTAVGKDGRPATRRCQAAGQQRADDANEVELGEFVVAPLDREAVALLFAFGVEKLADGVVGRVTGCDEACVQAGEDGAEGAALGGGDLSLRSHVDGENGGVNHLRWVMRCRGVQLPRLARFS